jgi:hypothetical protein
VRLRVVLFTLFAALALPVAAFADTPPATLAGEHFTGTFSESVGLCDSVPNPTILYHVSGIATGPYGGTFNETGRIVITPAGAGIDVAPLVDVTAHFTIDSPDGQVEGDKHFVATSTGLGQCHDVAVAQKLKTAKAEDLEYRAVISTGPGVGHRYVDCGKSDLFFTQNTTLPPIQAFGEDFISSLETVEREHPRGGPKARICD